MTIQIERFPEALAELNKELRYHDDLLVQLLDVDPNDIGEKLGTIAAYCGIVLDGYYSVQDLIGIAELCIEKLREKRAIILLN